MRAIKDATFAFACLLAAGPASAVPLTIVEVDGPAINCFFSLQCSITPTDEFSEIPIPQIQRKAFLMSRHFHGGAGSPGARVTAYQYRVDLKSTLPLIEFACVTNVTIDFGDVRAFQFDANARPGEVYMITKGVPQNQVKVASAEQEGNNITFTFERPVCANEDGQSGDTSFFFGLASRGEPRGSRALVDIPGTDNLPVKVFAPIHAP